MNPLINDTLMIIQTVNCESTNVYSDYTYKKVKKLFSHYTYIKNYANTSRDSLFIKYHREYPNGDKSVWDMFENYPVNYLMIISYRQNGWKSGDKPSDKNFHPLGAGSALGSLEIIPLPFTINFDFDEGASVLVEIQLDIYDVKTGKKFFSMYDYNDSNISDKPLSKEMIYNIEEILKDLPSIYYNAFKWSKFKSTGETQTD